MASDTVQEMRKKIEKFPDLTHMPAAVPIKDIRRWADVLDAAEAKKEKFQTERDAAEKRVAELEASEKALLEAHARRGARVAELEAENQKFAGALIEIFEQTGDRAFMSKIDEALEGTQWQSSSKS